MADLEGGAIFSRLGSRQLTARRAAGVISLATILLTVVSGLLIRVADPSSFPTIGAGLWWAMQTLTTVGYGDFVPDNAAGRLIATIVMLNGIAFLTVITAAVTATLIDQVRSRKQETGDEGVGGADAEIMARLDEINDRLDQIEGAVGLGRQDRRP